MATKKKKTAGKAKAKAKGKTAGKAKGKDWVVMTSGERPLGEVAKELKKSGFKVGETLHEIGMITGQGGDDVAAKLRKVKGVSDVAANVGADVGPPNSNDTW